MPSREFVAWQAFAAQEPLGSERLECYLAQVCALIVNANPYRRGGAVPAERFVIDFAPRAPRRPEDLVAIFKAWRASLPEIRRA